MQHSFPHPSRPGHHGLTLAKHVADWLADAATAMFPGDGTFPSGADAQVVNFVAERATESDVAILARLADQRSAGGAPAMTQQLVDLESTDPESFVYLRELLTHGYYSSRRVLAAMSDRGYDYHGAPQPRGYEATQDLLYPAAVRGTYVHTGEVRRARG